MENPYASRPDYAFWRRSVADLAPEAVDPVSRVPFRIGRTDRVATAGSCFAQHIAQALRERGFHYLVTETEPAEGGENFGVFPARFGNIYTVRQFRQLFERAYGLFLPKDQAWRRADGRYIDPFRPRIQEDGFDSLEALAADRASHLAATRAMFETCDVLVFTLGLTEGWTSTLDGAVVPFAPGAVDAEPGEGGYAFENFSVDGMISDLRAVIGDLRLLNPGVRIVLTVSPVPLIATYEDRHVVVSTAYSKAALRVVAEMASASLPDVAYFPSFEIITSGYTRGRYLEADARNVTAEGVAHVMGLFARHFLSEGAAPAPVDPSKAEVEAEDDRRYEELASVICDEDLLDI